jgi:hypothetical protein
MSELTKALAILERTYPTSIWIQRLSPKTYPMDVNNLRQRELLEGKQHPGWRCKIGLRGGWGVGDTMEEAILAALPLARMSGEKKQKG